jgi:hypothetical protein
MGKRAKPIPEFYGNIFENVYDVFGETAEEVVYGLSLHLKAEVLRKAIADLEAVYLPNRIKRLQEC